MANKYYAPNEQRAAKVSDLFATIAPRYDLINDLQSFGLHRLWKRRLVKLAAPMRGERALDLCCGTGDVAFALAGRGVDATGLDFSEAMLNVARKRAERSPRSEVQSPRSKVQSPRSKVQSPRSKVQSPKSEVRSPKSKVQGPKCEVQSPRFLWGDAQEVPFPDGSFDIVTMSYGLRNLASWERGLAEMGRVAKRGGRLLVLDFGKPDNTMWRAVYFSYLRACVPLFGRIFCGDRQTYGYILESLRHYPAQHGVAARMRELGFRDVRIVLLLGGVMTINYGVKP